MTALFLWAALAIIPQSEAIPTCECDRIDISTFYSWNESKKYHEKIFVQVLLMVKDDSRPEGYRIAQWFLYKNEEIRKLPDGRFRIMYNKEGELCFIVAPILNRTNETYDRDIASRSDYTNHHVFRDTGITPRKRKEWKQAYDHYFNRLSD